MVRTLICILLAFTSIEISAQDLFSVSGIVSDGKGELPSGKSFKLGGYWAWGDVIANLTPIDYFVAPGAANSSGPGIRDTVLRNAIAAMDTLRSRLPIEKLYVQTDKPYYSAGDTLWFKAYLFDAAFLNPASKSGLLYMELANDSNKVVMRRMASLKYGLGAGYISLDKEEIPEGSYTLRFYTNWMRNFGEDYIFKKSLYIGSAAAGSWLVNSRTCASRDTVAMSLQFNQLNRDPLGLRELQLRVMEDRNILMRSEVQTEADGSLDVNFSLPERSDAKKITLVARDMRKREGSRTVVIPVPLSRPENTDLQFMTEGGHLVQGVPSRVGFKAVGEDGKGAPLSGKIYDSRSQEITSFSTLHRGMGSFELTPQAGESYTAKVTLSDGTVKSYPLPEVRSSGTAMRVSRGKESDSLEVTLKATAGQEGTYYLIGQSRGVVCYGAPVRFNSKGISSQQVAKNLFPTGIARFSLLNAANQPLNERIIFIDHNDNLQISLAAEKPVYHTRDSIALTIEVKDREGRPMEGSFSLAVTDDRQVRADSSSNILSGLLLTSDLKGDIEDPGYYLQNNDQARAALDNLLLTQGWTGYSWQEVFSAPKPVLYPAEPEFMVQGRVSNVLGRGVAGTSIQLFSPRPLVVMDTLTNAEGRFVFRNFPAMDTAAFRIQARNRGGKSFNVGIEADEFEPPVFAAGGMQIQPWYVNSDTTLLRQISTSIERQQEPLLPGGGRMLGEVIVTAKKIVPGSKNLNGPGEADQIFDEKDMEKARKMTLRDLLFQKVKGFRVIGLRQYMVFDKPAMLIIDGHLAGFEPYTEYYTAEDVLGIEVMYSSQYNWRYQYRYGSPAQNYAYIELTTRWGKGPFVKHTPGTYLYKPMLFAGSKEFYRPKYFVRKSGASGDVRSTIHWEPYIFTDKEGKARVSFYSADRPGMYALIIEGTDMDGRIGYQRKKITIAPD